MDNISFQSKINFVDAKTFEAMQKGVCATYSKFAEGKQVFTEGLRTCTGAVILDNQKARACHNFDNKFNVVFADVLADEFLSGMKPKSGFLIGSKKLFENNNSIPLFQKFKKCLKSKISNLSIFEEHTYPYSETDFAYNLDTDTLTLCSMFRRPTEIKERYVTNIETLKECFKKITISKNDKLYFNDVESKL